MAKISLKGVATIIVVGFKSCCRIFLPAVMVTVRKRFSAVTNAVATVNERCFKRCLTIGYAGTPYLDDWFLVQQDINPESYLEPYQPSKMELSTKAFARSR